MEPQFQPGDRVRIRVNYPARHFRTPGYIQGKIGHVVGVHGAFRNPEALAYGGDGLPKQFLYLVRFPQSHIWNTTPAASDTLYIDIYEPWLESA